MEGFEGYLNYDFKIMNLKNKKIVLTGASKGIGYELSKQLAEQGAELVLIGRNFTQAKLSGNHTYIEADFGNKDDLEKISQALESLQVDALWQGLGFIRVWMNLRLKI